MPIDKQALKKTLLSLKQDVIAQADAAYQDFVSGAQLDAEQTIDDDTIAQAVTQRNLAEEAEARLHEHQGHLDLIEAVDFKSKSTVAPGAIVKLEGSDRHLVVALATAGFVCEGRPYLGISTDSPLYVAMAGLSAGDSFELNGRERTIELVS